MNPERERSVDGILCWTLKPQIEWMKNIVCLVVFKNFGVCLLSFAACTLLKEKQLMELVTGHWCWFKTPVRLCLWNLYMFCHVLPQSWRHCYTSWCQKGLKILKMYCLNWIWVLCMGLRKDTEIAYITAAPYRDSARNVGLPDNSLPLVRVPLILDTEIALCWLLNCYCYWNIPYSACPPSPW